MKMSENTLNRLEKEFPQAYYMLVTEGLKDEIRELQIELNNKYIYEGRKTWIINRLQDIHSCTPDLYYQASIERK